MSSAFSSSSQTRALFDLPPGVVYLDGNSLGPLPKAARERIRRVVNTEWGGMLIGGWNDADWIDLPTIAGDKIARLIGAPTGSVLVGDSTSVNLFKVLCAAISQRPKRPIVLSDTGNFPNDLYVAQSAIKASRTAARLETVSPEAVSDRLDDDVAVLMLTEVDYRTGRLHDMVDLTARAHAVGAVTVWDLAHSAGAIPVDVSAANADFAVGCGYKFLNGGPGAPAFVYIRSDLQPHIEPALAGWFGHEHPFAFEPVYRPAKGIGRMQTGTPPILSLSSLDAALDIWRSIDMRNVRAQSIALCDRLIRRVEAACPDLVLASPRDPEKRGSQVSFQFAHGYAAMQALISRGVVGDFRAPNLMRFGIAPLYVSEDDIDHAASMLVEIVAGRSWDTPAFHQVATVT